MNDLTLTRDLDAPCDLVFEVWSQPKHLVNWWGPNDFTLPHCETDFRVGGRYRFCMLSPDGEEHWVTGVYQRISEYDAITFTWIREGVDGKQLCNTVVNLTIEDINGRTRLTLHHTGFDSLAYRDEHIGGWSECLDRLAAYVAD